MDEKKLLKLASKPTYVSSKIFNENLVGVYKIKETLTLNRPAYVGMCILDLSKTLMYDFHYNFIKNKYGNKAKLLFTDTDSLCHEIETNDVYQDFCNNKNKFDNSDYPENSQFYDKSNKKVIGKFKDEASGILSRNSSACDLKCIHISKTMIKIIKQLRESTRLSSKRILSMIITKMFYQTTNKSIIQ